MSLVSTKVRTLVRSEVGHNCPMRTEMVQSKHYANMSVQYTAIFHGSKNDNFQMKIFDIFLIFAQNIDCGYTLEPPQ